MDVYLNRYKNFDDVHNLNNIICKNDTFFSSEFLISWHSAYDAYMSERKPIKLIDGDNPNMGN